MENYAIKSVTYRGRKIETIIDKEDEYYFDQHTWTGSHSGNGRIYILRQIWNGKGEKQSKIYWHRFITNAPSDRIVDHINGDSLDNRKSNLRVGSRAQNNMNRAGNRTRRGKSTTSHYK